MERFLIFIPRAMLVNMDESETLCIIWDALSHIRIKRTMDEIEIQREVELQFRSHKIPYDREVRLAPRCRLDFLVDSIAVEVKKRRPAKARLVRQIEKYASLPNIKGVIIVLERHIDIPEIICQKPVKVFSLNRLWGVAI